MGKIWGQYHVNGTPTNGVTVKAWTQTTLGGVPAKGDAVPGSGEEATDTTASANGADGAYLLDDANLVAGDGFWISMEYQAQQPIYEYRQASVDHV